MKLKKNIDCIMSDVRMSEEMCAAILKRRGRNRRCSGSKRRLAFAAAILFAVSTMYVGAGYLMEHTPLQNLFVTRKYLHPSLPVSEQMQRQDIYDEIQDSRIVPGEKEETSGTDGPNLMAKPLGEAGEKVFDNEMYSVELLETTCSGREITISYILTKKAWRDNMIVDVWVDTNQAGEIMDGTVEDFDSEDILVWNTFTDSYGRILRKDSGYTLGMNQELCVVKEIGEKDFKSGTYTLYGRCHISETDEEDGTVYYKPWVDEEGNSFCSAPIEIVGNSNYGLDVRGSIDATVERFHIEEYQLYISPLTLYLNLAGESEGGVDAIWSRFQYEILLGFEDGSETRTSLRAKAVEGYGGQKNVEVDMLASFDEAIDPNSIVRIVLNDVTIMEKE